MSSAEEALAARNQFGSAAKAGIDTLSVDQEIEFTLYVRLVLPLDGFVFWVRAETLSPSALMNAFQMNASYLNQPSGITSVEPTLKVMGSLHYETTQQQEEDATYAVNRVVFTAENPVTDFNQIGPDLLYLATFQGIRFAFSSRASFYFQTELHHYVGHAVYSMFENLIIDDPASFSTKQLVVSNSLPAWLALNQYAPVYPVPLPQPLFPLYPSFLSPSNWPPIYGTVHVEPDSTEGVAAAPFLSRNLSHAQLTRERVTVTLYGVNNDLAMTFLDSVLQYQLDVNPFGISNIPIVRDDKRTQNELSVVAMKKRIIFEINYYQTSMRNIARQLIESCVTTIYAEDHPLFIRSAPIVPIIR